MNDELAVAWTTLRTTPLGSLDNDTDLERVEKAILTVLAALERALPLLPLVDIIERITKGSSEWQVGLEWWTGDGKFRASCGRNGKYDQDIAVTTLTSWPDAIRALKQALESEAKT